MGIWPPYSNGSEVNSVDVCVEKGLVVTANDRAGLTRLFNYPCVVKIGPPLKFYYNMARFLNPLRCACLFSSEQGLQRPQRPCHEVQISSGRGYGGHGRRPRRVASDLGLRSVTE